MTFEMVDIDGSIIMHNIKSKIINVIKSVQNSHETTKQPIDNEQQ